MIIMNDIQKQIQEELSKVKNSKAAKLSDKQLAAIDEHGAKIKAAKASWTPEQKAKVQEEQNASRNRVVTTAEYRKKKSDITKEKNKDPEYRKKYLEANDKKYDNPEYWENYYAGIAKRDADEEYTKKRLDASRAKICKKVHTPLGVFDSITEASKAYGMGNSETMRHRIKSPNFPEFYIVE